MFLDAHYGRLTDALSGRTLEADEIARRVAERMHDYHARGLAPSDRVFIHFGNTPEFFVELLAVWTLGGCAVPVDSRFTPFEIKTLAAWARPRFCVFAAAPEAEVVTALSQLPVGLIDVSVAAVSASPRPPRGYLHLDSDALILFTSGTTGDPKGVVHTHRSLRARWTSLRQSLGIEPYQRTLCLLPTHFGHGLICNCLFPWLSGQHLFILPPFKADLMPRLGAIIDQHRISFLSSVPSVWRLALRIARPPDGGSLQRVSIGSAPLSASLWKSVQEWVGTKNVMNAYGITETGSWLAGTTVPDFEPEDGLVGVPWGGVVQVRNTSDPAAIGETGAACGVGVEGHVWVQTPALMRGYLDRDDLTAKVVGMGWFCTGDIGVVDERGWLYLRGREREEINKGGMKVHPADVDSVVERFVATTDVCTFAFEDELLGEDVGIAVVLKDKSDATLLDLYRWATQHLASHQVPRRWYVVDELPRTSRGKVNRATVAGQCGALKVVDMARIARAAKE